MKLRFLAIACFLGAASTAFAQEAPPSKTIERGPFTLTIGYDDGGVAGTLKGSQLDTLGSGNGRYTQGYSFDLDAVGHSSDKKPSNATLSARFGLVELNPGYPRSAFFVDFQSRSGNFESGGTLSRADQYSVGATALFVPRFASDWLVRRVSIPASEYPTDPCHILPRAEAMKLPECKAVLEKERSSAPALELPPRLMVSWVHPIHTSSNDAQVPSEIDADKVTVELEANNRIGDAFGKPLRAVLDLSATVPVSGSHKRIAGKIDAGLGIDVSNRFTPIVKYVSGRKDGFEYDKSVIVGLLWNLFR